ncbi:hypothetical protein [Polaribacter sp.]|uniref:hypothetical protein n=1 Tax=Polaribacter sp. TaxID=1920175 RepID=UPI003F6ACD3E
MKKTFRKIILLGMFVLLNSCEQESTCETKRNCYPDGNGGQTCVETPIPGTCIDNNFGF